MNDERAIEKLLRRYAKKRQADAGAPLEMHPATRRLLQAAVARRFGEAGRQPTPAANAWSRFWRGWGRQLAWATPVLVTAGVVVWALRQEPVQPVGKLPDFREATSATTPPPTEEQAQPLAPAPQARAPSADTLSLAERPAVPPPAAAAPVVVESFKALETPRSAARLLSEAGPTPDVRPSSAAVAQGEAVETAPPAPDSARIGAVEPAAPEERAFFAPPPLPAPTNVLSQAFVNAASGATATRRTVRGAPDRQDPSAAGVPTQVLSRFQLVQSGSQLQVVDADGSVYVAEVAGQSEPAVTPAVREATASAVTQEARRETARRRGVKAPAAQAAVAVAQTPLGSVTNALRAVGTNRTLNQQVEFVWNFAPLTNGTEALWGRLATATAFPALQNVQLPLPPSVGIVGRVRIGNTHEIEVRAVPENSQ